MGAAGLDLDAEPTALELVAQAVQGVHGRLAAGHHDVLDPVAGQQQHPRGDLLWLKARPCAGPVPRAVQQLVGRQLGVGAEVPCVLGVAPRAPNVTALEPHEHRGHPLPPALALDGGEHLIDRQHQGCPSKVAVQVVVSHTVTEASFMTSP